MNDGRTLLLETGNIVAAGTKLLRTMHNLRASGNNCPIFYLSETWINQNHSEKNIWQDSKEEVDSGSLLEKAANL